MGGGGACVRGGGACVGGGGACVGGGGAYLGNGSCHGCSRHNQLNGGTEEEVPQIITDKT